MVCVEANVMVAQLRCCPPSVLLHNLAPEKAKNIEALVGSGDNIHWLEESGRGQSPRC